MRRSLTCPLVGLLALAVLAAAAPRAAAQDIPLTERGPRFLAATGPNAKPVEIDASRSVVLRRGVSLNLDRATIGTLLEAIERQTGLTFVFSRALLQVDRPVHLRAERITVGAALMEILIDTGMDVLLSPGRQVALVRRGESRGPAGSVVGHVTDAKTGEAIVGAEVLLEGTRWRRATGDKGYYQLTDVSPGTYVLVARRIGYAKQSRSVTVVSDQEATADVALQPAPTQLTEIITTATGEQRALELGHVVGRINADSLMKEAPISSLSELLTGRVPGLQVFQAQGTVGGQVTLQVRGQNSLVAHEPVVIVDGVRYTTAQPTYPYGTWMSAGSERSSRLNDLNPNDIESVEVVKGPSAATLYGTDAAHGVIVIHTKRGRPGPARWNAYARGSTAKIPTSRMPDVYWGWYSVAGVPSLTSPCTIDGLSGGYCTQDSITVLPSPLDNPDLNVFGAATSWESGLNVSGGQQDLRYFFSGTYENAKGPVKLPPSFEQSYLTQHGITELPKWLQNPNGLSQVNVRSAITAVLGAGAELRLNTGYVRNAVQSLPFENPFTYGLRYATPAKPYSPYEGTPSEAFAQQSTEKVDRFLSSATADWRPLGWLQSQATVGLDIGTSHQVGLLRRGDMPSNSYKDQGSITDDRVRQVAASAKLSVTATVRRGRVSSRTTVGAQYERNLSDGISSFGQVLRPGGTSVGDASTVRTQQVYGETITLGSYFEESVGFNDRLFLIGGLRIDGASSFGQDYGVTAYPKISASWLVSEEPFMPRVPGLEELRLRYAYGASGQQPTSSQARPYYRAVPGLVDGGAGTIVSLQDLGNPDLRPERIREHEVGFDATAFGGRGQIRLTWYKRKTIDQLVVFELPPGYGYLTTNLGLTRQHGFEAELTAHVLDTRPLSVDLVFQHALHRTTLVDIGNGFESPYLYNGFKQGYPLGARFQNSITYADANGNGLLENNEVQSGDAVYVGESTPPQSQSLTAMVGLFNRRVRLSALLQRSTGFTQINDIMGDLCSSGRCRDAVDPTTPLARQAEIIATRNGSGFFFAMVEPGDFTRLREVSAAVDLPASFVRALRVNSASLSLAARNLALWSDFTGPDPESLSSYSNAAGIPQGRSWTLRLDLGL